METTKLIILSMVLVIVAQTISFWSVLRLFQKSSTRKRDRQ